MDLIWSVEVLSFQHNRLDLKKTLEMFGANDKTSEVYHISSQHSTNRAYSILDVASTLQ